MEPCRTAPERGRVVPCPAARRCPEFRRAKVRRRHHVAAAVPRFLSLPGPAQVHVDMPPPHAADRPPIRCGRPPDETPLRRKPHRWRKYLLAFRCEVSTADRKTCALRAFGA